MREESPLSCQGIFYMYHPIDRIEHSITCVTPAVDHWLEWEIANGPSGGIDPTTYCTLYHSTFYLESNDKSQNHSYVTRKIMLKNLILHST